MRSYIVSFGCPSFELASIVVDSESSAFICCSKVSKSSSQSSSNSRLSKYTWLSAGPYLAAYSHISSWNACTEHSPLQHDKTIRSDKSRELLMRALQGCWCEPDKRGQSSDLTVVGRGRTNNRAAKVRAEACVWRENNCVKTPARISTWNRRARLVHSESRVYKEWEWDANRGREPVTDARGAADLAHRQLYEYLTKFSSTCSRAALKDLLVKNHSPVASTLSTLSCR